MQISARARAWFMSALSSAARYGMCLGAITAPMRGAGGGDGKLRPVGQLHGNHIASSDAEGVQAGAEALGLRCELCVSRLAPIVVQRNAVRFRGARGKPAGQRVPRPPAGGYELCHLVRPEAHCIAQLQRRRSKTGAAFGRDVARGMKAAAATKLVEPV